MVRHSPVIADLAVSHTHDIDGLELNLLPRWGYAPQLAQMRSVVRLKCGYAIAVRNLPMDFGVKIGKAARSTL
jgi:hypothetical protein